MQQKRLSQLALVLVCLVLLAGCSGQKAIVVDTTGLTPEQIVAVEWRVKYAVAVDWYDWELKSYKASLDALPVEKAKEIHAQMRPAWKAVDTSVALFKAAVYAQAPTVPEQEAAYDAYLQSKAAILALVVGLFN